MLFVTSAGYYATPVLREALREITGWCAKMSPRRHKLGLLDDPFLQDLNWRHELFSSVYFCWLSNQNGTRNRGWIRALTAHYPHLLHQSHLGRFALFGQIILWIISLTFGGEGRRGEMSVDLEKLAANCTFGDKTYEDNVKESIKFLVAWGTWHFLSERLWSPRQLNH